jgi:nucleoside-diphosphate-sugar epimerase
MDKKTVLVFGGNGFIGVEVIEYLLNNAPDYEFVLVNRGNWGDWDSAERIKHRIKENIICDRHKDSLKKCLHQYLNQESFIFEAVIDFSAFKSRVIKNVIKEIPAEKIKRYILISTDSVYEVCVDKKLNQNEPLILQETDAIRPESKEEQNRLKSLDSYGHHKFK